MLLSRMWGRELRMVWTVEKGLRRSFLIGTAHFFPHSFRGSLARRLRQVNTVLLEGPLDAQSMSRVVDAGLCREGEAATESLLDALDRHTLDRLSRLLAPSGSERLLQALSLLAPGEGRKGIHELVGGMKHWMAFFTLWTGFLRKKGWTRSVDLEIYALAGEMRKKIVFLETIEEQIAVLEGLSRDRIIAFLESVDRWDEYSRHYARCYLAGDLAALGTMAGRFPSRIPSVIENRDQIFFERMRPYLDEGGAAACVGAPHVPGILRLLQRDGFITRH